MLTNEQPLSALLFSRCHKTVLRSADHPRAATFQSCVSEPGSSRTKSGGVVWLILIFGSRANICKHFNWDDDAGHASSHLVITRKDDQIWPLNMITEMSHELLTSAGIPAYESGDC